jgi:hypothetical protein
MNSTVSDFDNLERAMASLIKVHSSGDWPDDLSSQLD